LSGIQKISGVATASTVAAQYRFALDRAPRWDTKGTKDTKGIRVTKGIKGIRVTKATKGIKDTKGIKATKDTKDIRVTKGIRAIRDTKVTKVIRDTKVTKAIRGLALMKFVGNVITRWGTQREFTYTPQIKQSDRPYVKPTIMLVCLLRLNL
jgi:hypothetical protein